MRQKKRKLQELPFIEIAKSGTTVLDLPLIFLYLRCYRVNNLKTQKSSVLSDS